MGTDLKNITMKLDSVTVFRNITSSAVMKNLISFLECQEQGSMKVRKYADFVAALYDEGCDLGKYILRLVLEDENEYVIFLSQKKEIPGCMKETVKAELRLFSEISALSPEAFADLVSDFDGHLPLFDNTQFDFEKRYDEKIARLFKDGYGIYSKYSMFNIRDGGEITPLRSADAISIDDLVGYESERQKVIDNTKALIEGKPAANILLCGDAGTGKSSTVKAVVNLLADEGVRLIELRKEQLMSLPVVMEEINHNPLKFIIFIDDLSFNNGEEGFGTLKAILEGSASARANNAVIYATSNRRHLVKETFSDRDGDDVHRSDTIQELVSLSERFGLTIFYSKPNKELYLKIVKSLAEKEQLEIPDEELFRQAEAFALRKGSRSARAARQFIDASIAGRLTAGTARMLTRGKKQ
ncbi:MAG: ATP-binding protein [Acutalibacteraceae bacterium]